jgi:hypothetical protein
VADERGRGPGDTLYDEHEPTEQVRALWQDAPAAHGPAEPALAPRPSTPDDPERPVFVSMKPLDAPADRTAVVPAIDRPDMRPRLRPVSERPLRHPTPLPLGNYAPLRVQGKRSLLWLYVILALAAALAGAGIALWIRAAW